MNFKHSFSHDYLKLSTDYKLLWDLIQSGNRVPAWLNINQAYSYCNSEEPIWDIVEVRNRGEKPNRYSISSRGIGYEGLEQSFVEFERICKKYSLHFVCPSKYAACPPAAVLPPPSFPSACD